VCAEASAWKLPGQSNAALPEFPRAEYYMIICRRTREATAPPSAAVQNLLCLQRRAEGPFASHCLTQYTFTRCIAGGSRVSSPVELHSVELFKRANSQLTPARTALPRVLI
jgi:hypothetical protein